MLRDAVATSRRKRTPASPTMVRASGCTKALRRAAGRGQTQRRGGARGTGRPGWPRIRPASSSTSTRWVRAAATASGCATARPPRRIGTTAFMHAGLSPSAPESLDDVNREVAKALARMGSTRPTTLVRERLATPYLTLKETVAVGGRGSRADRRRDQGRTPGRRSRVTSEYVDQLRSVLDVGDVAAPRRAKVRCGSAACRRRRREETDAEVDCAPQARSASSATRRRSHAATAGTHHAALRRPCVRDRHGHAVDLLQGREGVGARDLGGPRDRHLRGQPGGAGGEMREPAGGPVPCCRRRYCAEQLGET